MEEPEFMLKTGGQLDRQALKRGRSATLLILYKQTYSIYATILRGTTLRMEEDYISLHSTYATSFTKRQDSYWHSGSLDYVTKTANSLTVVVDKNITIIYGSKAQRSLRFCN